MTRVLIIEDEQMAAESLWEEIRKLRPDWELIAVEESVQGSVKALRNTSPDLIFMDVHLSDGISFEIFKQHELSIPIIFITAYDEYAIDAFRHNSIHYLLKPVDPLYLKEAIDKYEASEISVSKAFEKISKMVEPDPFQKRFSVQIRDKIHSIPVEDVAFFLGEDKYVYLFTAEGKKFLIDTTLRDLENKLDPKLFFRINRKFIVSFGSIREMIAYSKSRVKVILTPEPPNPVDAVVSVERSPDFKKWINR